MPVRIGPSRWEVAFNILAIVNLLWNILVAGILMDAVLACGDRYGCSILAAGFWMLGELIFGPPLLVSIVALIVIRGRWRHTWVGWISLVLAVSVMALMLTAL